MSRMTIRARLVASLLALLVVSVASLVTVLTIGAARNLRKASEDDARHSAEISAVDVQRTFDSAFVLARDLRSTAEIAARQKRPDRAFMDAVERDLLAAHPENFGVWTAWEPNAFDGRDAAYRNTHGTDKTGRYQSYWHRTDSGEITLDSIVGIDDPSQNSWYTEPKQSGRETILEPYGYQVNGRSELMTSAEVPIVRDGKFIGLAGDDLILNSLNTRISGIRPFGVGRAILVSTGGNIVAGATEQQLSKPLGGALGALAGKAVAAGNTVSADTSAQLRFAVPVRIGTTATWALVVTIPTSALLAPTVKLRQEAIVIALAALLLSGIAALLLARAVVAPIARLRDRMTDIADGEGDLTQRVSEDPHTEVGRLGAAFNRFVLKVADAVRGIAGAADALAVTSRDITEVSERLAGSARASAEQAALGTGSAGQVSQNVESVAAGAEEMGASIREIAENAAEAARVTASAVQAAKRTTETMSRLGDSSDQIGEVLQTITSIAEQTNLLALNATIEAARAGESGKGFAVVASEVKELAQETARATEDISGRIGTIKVATAEAVAAINEIADVINRISDYSTTIASAVEEQTATTNEMSRSVGSAATGSREIAAVIAGVADAAAGTTAGAGETQDAAGRLAELSARLRTLVGSFRY